MANMWKCLINPKMLQKVRGLSMIMLKLRMFTLEVGFPDGSEGKAPACVAGDPASIPGLGRSPGEGNGNPLQYSFLENHHGQRSLAGYSPWDHTESDMTKQLTHQVNELSTFLRMGGCKHLGSLESFLWHAPQLSRAGILCFPHPESSQGAYPGWLQWLTARCWASWFPQRLLSVRAAVTWQLDGRNILCLLTWPAIF